MNHLVGMRRGAARLGAAVVGVAVVGCALFACDAGTSDPQDTAATSAGGKADDANAAAASIGVAVTATSIEALKGELGSLEPEVAEFVLGDPVSPPAYLRDMAALGHYGPIGPYGPLGVLGPVGDDVWSPSRFFELAGPWAAFASRLSALDGPLSAVGPLGEDGPLNRERWRDILDDVPGLAPAMADQLEPGGLFAVLGPAGPLGALGPLGPLGPVGAHGYVPNEHGEWIPGDEVDECAHSDERGVCRTAVVPWNGEEQRVYELVEHYDEAFAREKTDNDTSFMVTGALDDDEQDRFEFTSQRTQLVTVLVLSQWTMYDPGTAMGLLASAAGRGYDTPSLVLNFPFPFNLYDHETSFDDFDLTLTVEGAGETRSLRSESGSKVDWVSVVVPKDTKLTATIELHSHWSAPWRVFGPEYRLVVVGATPALSSVRVRGDHQLR